MSDSYNESNVVLSYVLLFDEDVIDVYIPQNNTEYEIAIG